MKKAIKKISAIALAFTILGTGTTITNKVAPQTNNILKAKACSLYSTGKHDRTYRLKKSSEKIGKKVYCYQWYACDCGYHFRVIEEIHSA